MQINIIACGPQQPEKTTPKTRHYPTCDRAELPEPHHSNAKQLDVYNTSQPLPSSLTEVYSDLHLFNRSDNQLHHAAKQLDDNSTTNADADADAGDALKSRERILSAPQRMYTQNNDASNHLFENPGQKSLAKEAHKIGSLPKRVTTTVVGCSTNNCLTEFKMIKCS